MTTTAQGMGGAFAGAPGAAWGVLGGVALCHCINDIMQSLVSAIYPLLHDEFALDYWQIGLLTFAFTVTASVLQPVVGVVTDKRPMPLALPLGMGSTLLGIVVLALAPNYPMLVLGAMMIGVGSSIFHPEASRVARAASGGRYGTAQSVFQVGGNVGHAVGPLLAAFIVAPFGRPSLLAFTVLTAVGIGVLRWVSEWHRRRPVAAPRAVRAAHESPALSRGRVLGALLVLGVLVFTKNAYTSSLSSFYTFYVIERFGLTAQQSQLMLFVFLGGMALGVIGGGPIGDRIGPLAVIWVSILGVLPFTLALPYAGLWASVGLTFVIGVVIASAFPAIVVFAQELVPGRVGLINGIFFGLAFGMGGLAAAGLGALADARGIEFVYRVCAWLPALGLLTVFLPRGVFRGR
ncbi:MFS transporter [Rubellimicrobium aerolatum]|uniref:MFS transporter n=1 Tax=Rubellimicrobium aerolatum TaxID=490979 RepID=A0ABW0SFS4_9RHOB|nr:MFS transporter [Rubellimicrobium aerolatum]MBP1807301.1 FSR family fosmidomycin resistance protein-like MFS transporter [Rubellimicrobium aerolatum]